MLYLAQAQQQNLPLLNILSLSIHLNGKLQRRQLDPETPENVFLQTNIEAGNKIKFRATDSFRCIDASAEMFRFFGSENESVCYVTRFFILKKTLVRRS